MSKRRKKKEQIVCWNQTVQSPYTIMHKHCESTVKNTLHTPHNTPIWCLTRFAALLAVIVVQLSMGYWEALAICRVSTNASQHLPNSCEQLTSLTLIGYYIQFCASKDDHESIKCFFNNHKTRCKQK